jgi:outer membrane protein
LRGFVIEDLSPSFRQGIVFRPSIVLAYGPFRAKEIESYHERAEAARYDQVIQDITGQVEKANATLAGARRIAQNTPIQLQAARDTEQQASARYKAGLGNIVEVAEAQRILTQAEIDNALAKLSVWRALLGLSTASGDVQPFVQQTVQ